MISHRLWPALALSLATASCAEGGADFHARFEPDFTPGPTTVSVFGVFHDGRMSHESWEKIGPRLSPMLGQKACEVGYGDRLSTERPDLFAAVDASVRDEGITEGLLEQLAPSAEGEMILVVTLSGYTVRAKDMDEERTQNGSTPRRTSGSQLRSGPPRSGRGHGAELNEIGISGTLFSARTHHPVARLSMVYSGLNLDDAIGKFVGRLATTIPGSTCKGWRWGAVAPH
jgi:hypothetical protein